MQVWEDLPHAYVIRPFRMWHHPFVAGRSQPLHPHCLYICTPSCAYGITFFYLLLLVWSTRQRGIVQTNTETAYQNASPGCAGTTTPPGLAPSPCPCNSRDGPAPTTASMAACTPLRTMPSTTRFLCNNTTGSGRSGDWRGCRNPRPLPSPC